MKTILAILGTVFLSAFFVLIMYMGAHNTEVSLRNKFKAQQKANESSFDKTWKIIQQNAQVSERERDSFKEAFTDIMSEQKGIAGEGKLASFFTQSKIDISPELFKKLMTTIESQRESFHRDQQKLLNIVEQHDNILTELPSSIFVGGREKLEAIIVTSSKTNEAFSAGEDNEVNLFENKN